MIKSIWLVVMLMGNWSVCQAQFTPKKALEDLLMAINTPKQYQVFQISSFVNSFEEPVDTLYGKYWKYGQAYRYEVGNAIIVANGKETLLIDKASKSIVMSDVDQDQTTLTIKKQLESIDTAMFNLNLSKEGKLMVLRIEHKTIKNESTEIYFTKKNKIKKMVMYSSRNTNFTNQDGKTFSGRPILKIEFLEDYTTHDKPFSFFNNDDFLKEAATTWYPIKNYQGYNFIDNRTNQIR